jgi:hypothetical protein
MICVDYQMGRLTAQEAKRNIDEIARTNVTEDEWEHLLDVMDMLNEDAG